MAPLNPWPCSAKGCDCRTPSETNEDLKDQLEHLNSHSQAAHPENHAPALEEPESSGRPEAWEDMWSWQWESFQMEWEKYKREKSFSPHTLQLLPKTPINHKYKVRRLKLILCIIRTPNWRTPPLAEGGAMGFDNSWSPMLLY